jgi:hypothetical protein
MQKLIVNNDLIQRLPRIMHPVQLVDEAGHVLGVYQPDLSQYEGLEPQVSEEELDRIEQMGGGRTLDEIFRDLGLRR